MPVPVVGKLACCTDDQTIGGTIVDLEDSNHPLSLGTIFKFYSPLAISWLFMGLEGPICESVINRLERPEINAAAWPVLMAIAIWIESPVIDLLSTSTTLAKDRQRYELISRFVWYLLLWVTVAHALVVLTPLYDVVTLSLLGVKPAVAKAAHLGLIILIPWSGLIGWRRYLQGILIRNGRTRAIGLGTTARVSALLLVAIILFYSTTLPSVVIASIAIIISVATEAAFIHWLSRDVIASHFGMRNVASDEPLTMKKLVGFHVPLSITTMVNLLVLPLVNAGLARTPEPVLALAGCGIAGAVLFLHRAITFCLPEVVITLYSGDESRRQLRNFSIGVGAISSGLIVFLGLTRLDRFLFEGLIQAKPHIAEVAHWCYLFSAAVPLVDASQNYVRGILTAHHLTVSRLIAVLAAIIVLITGVVVGTVLRWNGPVLAGVSVTGALLAELLVLSLAWARARGGVAALTTR